MFKRAMIAGIALAAFATVHVASIGAARADMPNPLTFGIISTESSQGLKKSFTPFLEDMGKQLGVEVKAFFASDYAGVIEAMRFKKVDVAWFGNKSAMEAVDRAGGEVFVQTVDVTGNPGYWSLLLTQKDNDKLNKLEDVLNCDKSLTFGNGDPNSTSGFLVPSFYVFAKNDVDPKKCYKSVRNASHETNALSVANGQVDFATNNTESLSRLQKNHPDAYAKIKAIWKSPLIPNDPIVWRSDLDKGTKSLIKGFFLSYGRLGPNAEAERKILSGVSSGWAPFEDSSNAQLYPIRQLQLFKDKRKLAGDERMDAAEKAKKIAEIDRKLDVLKVLSENQLALR